MQHDPVHVAKPLPQHAAMINASGISSAVAETRGYRSITDAEEAVALGFTGAQARQVPALLVPVHGVAGDIVTYQIRPDHPRVINGKAVKYETPSESQMVPDVPVSARAALADPSVPLIITEGARKADAAVSRGACCIALLGVWGFVRGQNADGEKVALSDWERIALKGRTVSIAFDSDVMTNSKVRGARERLTTLLQVRGAQVRWVFLSALPNGGKVGLDDFLAAGHTLADVDALATDAPELLEHAPPKADRKGEMKVPEGMSLATLMGKKVAPRSEFVENILTEGVTIIAGRAKLGKSWLLDMLRNKDED